MIEVRYDFQSHYLFTDCFYLKKWNKADTGNSMRPLSSVSVVALIVEPSYCASLSATCNVRAKCRCVIRSDLQCYVFFHCCCCHVFNSGGGGAGGGSDSGGVCSGSGEEEIDDFSCPERFFP